MKNQLKCYHVLLPRDFQIITIATCIKASKDRNSDINRVTYGYEVFQAPKGRKLYRMCRSCHTGKTARVEYGRSEVNSVESRQWCVSDFEILKIFSLSSFSLGSCFQSDSYLDFSLFLAIHTLLYYYYIEYKQLHYFAP